MQGPSPAAEMLPVKGVARALGISRDTVYRMIEREELPAVRIGSGRGRFFVPLRDVREAVRLRASNVHPLRPTKAEQLVAAWHTACGTADPAVVLHWVAEGAAAFQAAFPDIVVQEPWSRYLVDAGTGMLPAART